MKDVLDLFGELPDFPGKTQPKNRPVTTKVIPAVSDDPFAGVAFRTLVINGETKRFYTVGAFAQVVGRTAKTIRKWEDSGWIPTPTYRSSKASGHPSVNKKNKGYRLYSKEQIETVYHALEINGLLGERNSGWQDPKKWLSFIEYIKTNWSK